MSVSKYSIQLTTFLLTLYKGSFSMLDADNDGFVNRADLIIVSLALNEILVLVGLNNTTARSSYQTY